MQGRDHRLAHPGSTLEQARSGRDGSAERTTIVSSAPISLVGQSIEWRGVHHSQHGDFTEISTHVVTYETADSCFITAAGRLVGEASYSYTRLDDQMGIVIYHPVEYQGRDDVTLYAMFDFARGTDRAVLTAGAEAFAVADGTMRAIATQQRP
jgi:hypothetical protein